MPDERTNLYIRKEDDSAWWVIGAEDVFQSASFVTVNAEGELDAERVLTGGDSISLVDGGADTTITVNLDTPGTVHVSSGNAAAAPHTHAVTSSSSPGAAASLLASDANGRLQLTGLGITAAAASNDLHIGTGQGITHADGVAAGMFLRANGTRYVPDTLDVGDITDLAYAAPNFTLTTANAIGAANTVVRSDASVAIFDANVPTTIAASDVAATGAAAVAARRDHRHGAPATYPATAHNVLSATHGDSSAAAVVRGDLVYGNATPAWARLALGGASGSVVTRNATDVAWSGYYLSGTAGGTTTLAVTNTKTLTLTAADSYNLTIPKTGTAVVGTGTAGRIAEWVGDVNTVQASTLIKTGTNTFTLATGAIAALTWTIPANAAGYLENDGAGGLSWAAGPAPAAHNLLSASHGDTLAGNVTDGDIIIGNGTPAWSELAISVPAANVRNVLGVDNGETRPSWKAGLDGNNPATLTVSAAAAPGTSLVFSHRDHVHPITSSSNPGGAAALLASAADGGLQLLRFGVGTDPDADNGIKIIDDGWVGLGSAAGRLVFDSTPNPDQIEVTTADLYFATASHGIIHVDGNQDGRVLVADGTRYVPGDLSDITGGEAQYVVMAANATLDNERVLTAGDGIDRTDGGAGGNVTLAVDVTDILGNGMNESANNIYCYALRQSDDGAAALQADADGDMTAYGSLAFNVAESITTNAGDLTIAPTGDVILNPTGNDVLPTANYDISLGSVSKKFLDLHTAEVTAGHVVATDTASGVGGRIVIAPTCLFAADLSSGTTNSAEKLSNTGFETAGGGGADVFANWTESAGDGAIAQDAAVYHGGANSCKLTSGASSNTLVYQDIVVLDTDQIILGFWTRGDGANAGRYRVYDNTNAADILAVASTGVTAATWTKIWYDFDVPLNCVSVRVYFYCPGVAAGYANFDDVTARTGVQITVTDDDMTDVDIAYAEAGGNVEWFEICSAAGGAGPYTYWVLRNLDGGGANTWYAGDALHNTGGQGAYTEGYIDVFGSHEASIQGTSFGSGAVLLACDRQSPTYNDVREVMAFTPRGFFMLEDYAIYWRDTTLAGAALGQISMDDSGAEIASGSASYFHLDQSGQASISTGTGGVTDANMTVGLCINQGANDNEALALKSSDVGHGAYYVETNTYGILQKAESTSGGVFLGGWKDSDGTAGAAFLAGGYLDENVDTTKGTAGRAVVEVHAYQTSGGALANLVADGNAFAVRGYRGGATVTLMIVDEDGDLHLDAGAGTGGTIHGWVFDEHDDLALLTGLRASTAPEGHELRERFAEFIDYARPILEATGVVHYNDGPGEDGQPFVSMRELQYLTIDALRQLYERCLRYERALMELGVNLMEEAIEA